MTQPDNFGFGEEAALLKESARKFFSDHFSADTLHGMVAGEFEPERQTDCLWDQSLWTQMVELGWSSLAVPEAAGGLGMPVVAVAGLVEELGRAAFPCPLLPTLSTTYLLAACGDPAHAALGEIAEGRAASLALADRSGCPSFAQPEVRVTDGKLHGTAWFVQDARKVDRFLVGAQAEQGLSLYWVAADASGLTLQADAIVDLTRDQAHLEFDGVEAQCVTSEGEAALQQAFPALWTLLAADIVGAAEWQLQTTVEYAGARQQFDRPLGFFQAVKHPLVDVMVQIDQSKSLVYNAACAIDCEPEQAARAAHMALASACETAGFASSRSVQYHGGIGFTWECFVHLYFKRQKHNQFQLGDAQWHRARLADIVLGEVA